MKTNKKEYRIRNRKKELFLELLIRWWGAGAVYFFIGWGTSLGYQQNPLDFIFILGMSAGLTTIVVLDPLIYGMLDIERKNGEIYNKKYFERTIAQNVLLRSTELLKALFIVFLVFLTYNFINISLIKILNLSSTSVPLKGEPIIFGLFYLGYYKILEFINLLLAKKKV